MGRIIWGIGLALVLTAGCDDGGASGDPMDAAPPALDAGSDDATPMEMDGAPPAEDGAPPADDAAVPMDDAAPPADDAAPPVEDGAPPADDAAPPVVDAAPPPPPEEDRSDEAFEPDALLDVQVEMAPDDWNTLRQQTRRFGEVGQIGCLNEPIPSPWTWFTATVTVNGERFEEVGVRKKGFFGSLDENRPSIKVHFEKFGREARFKDLKRMTLNNNRQDPSQMHQCLAYQIFREAGIPAPRCNYARVSVNGQPLGVYTHIDSMKKQFLRQHFDDDEGDFYEGQFSDFRDGWTGTFDKKTNDEDPRGPAIADITAALALPDDALLPALESHLDLDAFFRFWATETVTSHWDGYAGNTNNYLFYDDPTSGLVYFIPWGTDGTFQQGFGGRGGGGALTRASGLLHRRLYQHPDGTARYVEALRAALDRFDEEALYAEMDRVVPLIRPALAAGQQQGFDQAVNTLRQFIGGIRGRVEREIAAPPGQPAGFRSPQCQNQPPAMSGEPNGELTLSFDTPWGSYEDLDRYAGAGELDATANDQIYRGETGAMAGIQGGGGGEAGRGVIVGTLQQGQTTYAVRIVLAPALLEVGEHVVDGANVTVLFQTIVNNGPGMALARSVEGVLTIDAISQEPGGRISGRLAAQLVTP